MDPRVGQSLDGPFFCLSSKLCLCNSLRGYFVPHSKKEQTIHTLVFLLEFHVFCKLAFRSPPKPQANSSHVYVEDLVQIHASPEIAVSVSVIELESKVSASIYPLNLGEEREACFLLPWILSFQVSLVFFGFWFHNAVF